MKINVLIVDDSLVFRSAIAQSLAGEDDIEVIGSVRNGIKAMEFIRSKPIRPDLVTLDVQMPDMDGLETLAAIQEINASEKRRCPIGVIMVSAHTHKGAETTIRALEAGAFDFISKPRGRTPEESIEIIRRQLLVKIRYFASRLINTGLEDVDLIVKPLPGRKPAGLRTKCILFGVSTGGPRALAAILPAICDNETAPILIVQHMPPDFTRSLAESLNKKCRYTVHEAENNDILKENHMYIAPGNKHMLIRRLKGEVVTVINSQPPENGSRPSVDVLFRSASMVFGSSVIAVILTGMGSDGTNGIGAVKRAGGYVLAQDEATSVVWGMPGSAVASGHVDEVLPLNRIPEALYDITTRSR